MAAVTIFAKDSANPTELTRDMFVKYGSIMKEYGNELLSAFIADTGDEKGMRFAILNGIYDFCVGAEYPKTLLEV